MNRQKCVSLIVNFSFMLFASVLGISTQVYAQGRQSLSFDGITIDVGGDKKSSNRDHDSGNGKGDKEGNKSSAPADPHPALTAATNAYKLALATWQNAYQKHKTAAAALATVRFRASYSAVDMIEFAVVTRNEADAHLELQNAEKRRNEAEKVARDATKEVLAREAARQKIEADAKKAMRQDYQERKEPAGGNRDRH